MTFKGHTRSFANWHSVYDFLCIWFPVIWLQNYTTCLTTFIITCLWIKAMHHSQGPSNITSFWIQKIKWCPTADFLYVSSAS